MKKLHLALTLSKAIKETNSKKESLLYVNLLSQLKTIMTAGEKEIFVRRSISILPDNYPERIKEIIEDYFDIDDISKKTREGDYPYARRLYSYFCCKIKEELDSGFPLRIIGKHINASYSMVIVNRDKIKKLLDIGYKEVEYDVNKINQLIELEL